MMGGMEIDAHDRAVGRRQTKWQAGISQFHREHGQRQRLLQDNRKTIRHHFRHGPALMEDLRAGVEPVAPAFGGHADYFFLRSPSARRRLMASQPRKLSLSKSIIHCRPSTSGSRTRNPSA